MKLGKIIDNHTKNIQEIENQKQIAAEIIDILRSNGHSEAIIAGGAPRNWDFGRPANDLDVYVCVPFIEEQLSDYNSFTRIGKHYSDYRINGIVGVLETTIKGMKVQVICIDRKFKNHCHFARYVFDTFDFGICKIAWTQDGFVKTKEFEIDKKYKKITINMTNMLKFNNPNSIPRRWGKIKSYFPDHTLDII